MTLKGRRTGHFLRILFPSLFPPPRRPLSFLKPSPSCDFKIHLFPRGNATFTGCGAASSFEVAKQEKRGIFFNKRRAKIGQRRLPNLKKERKKERKKGRKLCRALRHIDGVVLGKHRVRQVHPIVAAEMQAC